MSDVNKVLSEILDLMKDTLNKVNLTPVSPKGAEKGTYTITENGHSYITLQGENASVRIEFSKDRVSLLSSSKPYDEALDGDYDQIAQCLLDLEEENITSLPAIAEEFSETLTSKYTKAKSFAVNKKMPVPISKSDAKNGRASYDTNTLASRLTEVYPELRPAYKANIEKYGEFLAEEFFIEHANTYIIATIKENNQKKMKKLFNLFNDIYENGTNDIQSLVAVTIFGTLENDQTLLANCVDFMDPDLCSAAIQVNKYLASNSAKGMRMKLENPPLYKPKKERKKSSFMQSLMGTEPMN
ncbi:MAG TPA: hypothetical protein VFD52_00280 [Clostridia bacterium]|nr:hypothetical protein [Clostridia bacterium]